MERIKDLSKITLQMHTVLLKMTEKKSSIIMTGEEEDASKMNFKHGTVIAKGSNVTSMDVGDIVLEFPGGRVYDWKGDKYVMVRADAVTIAVKPDNIELTE